MKKNVFVLGLILAAAFPFLLCADALKPTGKAVKLAPLSSYVILTPENGTAQEHIAARMLADYLKSATGLRLQIVREPVKTKANLIHIGETALAKSLGDAPARQSYSIMVKDKNLLIRGGVYGVTAFLEEDLGFRWYQKKDKAFIPKLQPNLLSVVPREYTPTFEIREPLYDDIMGENEWGVFNRIQPISYFVKIADSKGGGLSNTKYFIHTYDQLIPAKKYYETHPEYFPLKGGKRFKSSQQDGQLCYTSAGLANAMAKEIEQAIIATPGSRIYSISQNDNTNVNCECVECQKVIKTDGISGAAILLANRVAERLSIRIPDIRITTLAYVETQEPVKTIKPFANTVIFYAPIRERAGAMQYIPWKDIPKIKTELSEWRKLAKRIYVWDYANTATVPFPNFDVIDQNIDFWRKNGVTGVFIESKEFTLNSLSALKTWIFTKKLWDPNLDINLLIEDFIAGYYGNAAPEMRKYVDLQRKKWADYYKTRTPGASIVFSDEDRKTMQDLLEKAYKKTQNAKIATELCCFYAMTLTACTKANMIEYEKNLIRIKGLLAKHKLKLKNKDKANLNLIKSWDEQLNEIKTGRAIPVYCDDSIVLKDRSLWLKIKFVEDKDAYSGKAARQFANTNWGVQWNFAKFMAAAQNQGVYVARIRIKPQLTKKYPGNDSAFSLHLWRAGVKNVQGRYIKFSELKGNDWQYVYPFKVYVYSPAASGYFYNCIGKIAKDEAFLYDIIEFIPVEKFKDKQLADSLPQITL